MYQFNVIDRFILLILKIIWRHLLYHVFKPILETSLDLDQLDHGACSMEQGASSSRGPWLERGGKQFQNHQTHLLLEAERWTHVVLLHMLIWTQKLPIARHHPLGRRRIDKSISTSSYVYNVLFIIILNYVYQQAPLLKFHIPSFVLSVLKQDSLIQKTPIRI